MGARAQDEAKAKNNEVDVAGLPTGSRLEKLLADPQTRQIILKRIAERRKKLGESSGKGSESEQAHGGGTVDLSHKDLAEGEISVARGKKTTSSEDGVEHTHDTTTTLGHDKDGFSLGRKIEDERAVTEEHENEEGETEEKTLGSVKSAHSYGASGTISDGKVTAHAKTGYEKEAQIGEHKRKESGDASIGLTDGKFAADLKASQSTEGKHGSHETSQSLGYEDGKLTLGGGHTDEKKHKGKDGGETTTSRSSESSVSIGPEGVGADRSWSRTDAKGTQRTTTIGAEVGKEGASASASHSVKTKKGSSVTVSVKAGVKVEAEEPEKVGERWVVHYTRTESVGGGAGGKSHGMGVSVGAGHDSFTKGTRSFATEKEAKEFKEHAAERVREDADPHSAAGAMQMAVGESRGGGSSTSGSMGASGKFEGASFGGGVHAGKTDELNVTRVSATVFEVTVHHASEKGGDVHLGGGPITTSASVSSDQHDDLTMRFDLGTAEGKRAYEQFCKDHKVPARGGEVVATETGKGHTSTDGTKIMGLGSETFRRHTSEVTRTEGKNKYETYEGDQAHSSDPSRVGRWLGEKKLSDSVEVEASQKNDKASGYTVTGHIGGESGVHNRGKMQHLYGRDENWDESKVKASGEWTLTTDVDRRTINAMTKYSDRFKGKSQDDQMRALAQWVADDGMNAVNSIERWGNQSLSWDIELKGDKNFPGRAGREAIEERLRSYNEGLAVSGSIAPALVPGVEAEIAALSTRRAAVASTSNYTDLPTGLRQQQLRLIDKEIAGFQALRHRAAVEASKSQPGEDVGHIATRAYDAHGYDQAPAEQRPLMQVRDQIALSDGLIADCQRENAEASAAIRQALKHINFSQPHAAQILRQTGRLATEACQLDEQQRAQYQRCDTVRLEMLKSGDGARELALARGLLLELKRTLEVAQQVMQKFDEVSKLQILITSAKGLAGHEKFWDNVRENMNDSDYALILPDSSSSDEDEGEEATPPEHVSMKL